MWPRRVSGNPWGHPGVNAARELTLQEVEEIAALADLETEVFVHGAMCMAVSGRCLLSSFMAGREGNRGRCAHPCRWQYAVVEQTRPGQFMPVSEDGRGSYIFSARDLCMVEHLPDLVRAGVRSLKIEGRMKGIHYLATVVRVYRQALDACLADPRDGRVDPDWVEELALVSSRGYCTGFFYDAPSQIGPCNDPPPAGNAQRFLAKVLSRDSPRGVRAEVRNKIFCGQAIEILSSRGAVRTARIDAITDEQGVEIDFAQPGTRVFLTLQTPAAPNDLIRRQPASKRANKNMGDQDCPC